MAHDQSHEPLLPRPEERETLERLDELLEQTMSSNAEASTGARLVNEHVAALVANLQHPCVIGRRGVLDRSPAGVIRWVEVTLGSSLDGFVLEMLRSEGCPDCRIAWAAHLTEARRVIADWAALRELEAAYSDT